MAHRDAKASDTTARGEVSTEEQVAEGAPEATGAVTGLAAGAAVGALLGGPVGAALGAAIAGPIGAALGKAADFHDAEPSFRKDWEENHKDHADWDHAHSAYRYGWNSHDRDRYKEVADYEKARPELKRSWNQRGRFDELEPMIRTGWEGRLRQRIEQGDEVILPVVEERLKVGKRKVQTGGVRVRTGVVETPVEEQVKLHREKVKVERRPVDRPAAAGDAILSEGTLELTETAEEAVVAKEARVIEEVVLNRAGSDRTQTVRDTVRRTDVDVEETAPDGARAVGFDTFARGFEDDFRTRYAGRGLTFAEVRPAYRFGHSLANDPRYQGGWAAVEPEARRHWEERNPGTWETFKDAVRHAWDKVRGKA
jgi:uncharacterized protein (TIGR02271 family)